MLFFVCPHFRPSAGQKLAFRVPPPRSYLAENVKNAQVVACCRVPRTRECGRGRVGAKRGVFRGENGGGAGVFCTMAFGGKGGKAGGKTRKIRPSDGDLCSFRHAAGRSVQDCGKVVQKLAGREDENHKLCTTLCAPLRLGTRIVQVSFPLGVRCVGVAVRRCAIRSFSLPPAEAGCPFRRRGRGERTGRGGDCLVHLCLCTLDSAVGGQGRGTVRGGVRLCLRPPHPAFGASPISGRGHGRRQAVAGRTHGQGRGLPCALRLCAL